MPTIPDIPARYRYRVRAQRGLSLIELLVVIAVAALMIIALTMFVGRGFIVSREQFEQVRITEDARKELERISEILRDADFVDLNSDGFTNTEDERNLQRAKKNELVLYANIDTDVDIEKVRYFIDQTELKRAITERGFPPFYSGGEGTPQILIRTLRNIEQGKSLFRYYAAGSQTELLPDDNSERGLTPGQFSRLGRVRLNVIVDVNPIIFPPAADIYTESAPRSVDCPGGECGPLACSNPGSELTSYIPFAGELLEPSHFATDEFYECMAHCNTSTDLQAGGDCCSWNVSLSWDGDPNDSNGWPSSSVYSLCTCQEVTPIVGGTTVEVEDYSQFYRDCWTGTGQFEDEPGTPVCTPGCLTGPGQCTCTPLS